MECDGRILQSLRLHESLFLIFIIIAILAFEFLNSSLIRETKSDTKRGERSGSYSPVTREFFSIITLVISINSRTDRDKLYAFKACQFFSDCLKFTDVHIISDVILHSSVSESRSIIKISDISIGFVSVLPSRKSN